jgi:hypothetical protein
MLEKRRNLIHKPVKHILFRVHQLDFKYNISNISDYLFNRFFQVFVMFLNLQEYHHNAFNKTAKIPLMSLIEYDCEQ